jgi:NAD(P)H-dependent flavin oxidoreductase YrpB (nitropropane dioxygenase family)
MGPAITTPELAAAVSNAGGLGVVSFGGLPPHLLRELIHRMRSLTDKPFGVNFILQFPVAEHVAVCVDERVPVLSFFWGDAAPYVEPAHCAGLTVIDQVGSVPAARHSAAAGVDVVIAQGVEAGGHVIGQVSTMALVPCVVDAVAPVPVAAAGGIAGPRGLLAALALGAQGVVMGTRFLATLESAAHRVYKQRVVEASEGDTVYTTLFGRDWDAPHRAIRTGFVDEWLARPREGFDDTPIGETEFGGGRIPVTRGMSLPPTESTSGDIESMALLAGQSAGQVYDLPPAAAIIADCIDGARRLVIALATTVMKNERSCGLEAPG